MSNGQLLAKAEVRERCVVCVCLPCVWLRACLCACLNMRDMRVWVYAFVHACAYVYVACHHTDFIAPLRALVDGDFENLLHGDGFLARAGFALVFLVNHLGRKNEKKMSSLSTHTHTQQLQYIKRTPCVRTCTHAHMHKAGKKNHTRARSLHTNCVMVCTPTLVTKQHKRTSPRPAHSSHACCNCWTMPGPIWRRTIFTPTIQTGKE